MRNGRKHGLGSLSEEILWDNFVETGSIDCRNELFLRYYPLLLSVANYACRKLNYKLEQSECISFGSIGLLNAIEKYKVRKNFSKSFARQKIFGAIVDEYRKQTKFRRNSNEFFSEFSEVLSSTGKSMGDRLSYTEMSNRMGISEKDFRRRLMTLNTRPVTTKNLGEVFEFIPSGTQSIENAAAEKELNEFIRQRIKSLDYRLSEIMRLRFFEGMTIIAISRKMQIPEPFVDQCFRKAIQILYSDIRKKYSSKEIFN